MSLPIAAVARVARVIDGHDPDGVVGSLGVSVAFTRNGYDMIMMQAIG